MYVCVGVRGVSCVGVCKHVCGCGGGASVRL